MRALGLMCGTSLDGIDVALVDLRPRANTYDIGVVRSATISLESSLAGALLGLLPPNAPAPAAVARLDREVGAAFAAAALEVLCGETVDFVASHGVTLYHGSGTSVQIGDPFVLRERLETTVVADFRRADCAAGGEGAPLVPYVDALLFARDDAMRAALNLGGIANVTLIPPGGQALAAWDVGPANMLLDAFVRQRTAGSEQRDTNGIRAARGRIDERSLREMASDPYFSLPPPKSTGRERFGEHFLRAHERVLAPLDIDDGCATLVALSVAAIAQDLTPRLDDGCEVVVSGGGAHNNALMRALAEALPRARVIRSGELGVDVDAKEAIAFTLLGYETLRGRPANVPSATGARYPVLLGTIVPHRLRALLAQMDRELHQADGSAAARTSES